MKITKSLLRNIIKEELEATLEEEGRFITFSDGYKFKEVSKSYAASNWDKVEVYGIDISSESESLIGGVDDLNQPWDAFGIETKEGIR
tara:strand:- start:196 stop:459 length:264 start_codon:yes stop_codon:yes gene_type:complete